MKKLLSLMLVSIMLMMQIVPAFAAVNPANQVSFNAWYITVRDDEVIVEGAVVNDNNRETVYDFQDFYLDLYYEGQLIFTGYAGDFDKAINAGHFRTVTLHFTYHNCDTLLDLGWYDVRNMLMSDIAFTCRYY